MVLVRKAATNNAWLNQATRDIAGGNNANRYISLGLPENKMIAAMVMNGEKTKKTSKAPFKVFDMSTPPKIL